MSHVANGEKMTTIRDYAVESDVSVGGATIKAITDGEQEGEVSIVGHLAAATIGAEFTLPVDWTEERMEELGLYMSVPGERRLMAPPEPTPKSAFTRTRDLLFKELATDNPRIRPNGERAGRYPRIGPSGDYDATIEIDGRSMGLESKKATNDEWYVTAEAYFTAEELEALEDEEFEDGDFRQATVSIFRYNKEKEGIHVVPKVGEEENLREVHEIVAEAGVKLFSDLQESYIGRDIQKMWSRYTSFWTDSIKVRDGGGVYFVPAGYDDSIRGLKILIEEIDERWKTRGKDCELLRIAVTDSEEERKQIKAQAEKRLEKSVESALDEAFSKLSDDDAMVEELGEQLRDDLKDLESFAGDYNALLKAQMSAQQVVRERLSDLSGAKEEIVKEALEEAEA